MLVYPGQMQGGPGGQMPGAVPVPGASVYPPQFTYGLQQNYGGSTPMTSMAAGVGSIPTAMSTVGMVAGVGSLFSKAPMLRGLSFLDPASAGFNVGATRYGASRLAGAGIGEALGAGAMAGAGPLALGMAALEGMRYTGQQFMTGAREQQMLGAQLGGIGFANSGAMGGRGFGFGQQRQIGQMMREIDAADPFTTMSSLNKSMDQFTGLGMHRGIEDAKEFAKKFESFAKTTKEMAKIMGKTQEEAGAVFAQMKHSGFYTANDVMGNTRMMGVAKGMGMDEQLFHGMQGQGAGTSRAMGMRGRAGAVSSSRFAADLMLGATSRASGGTGAFSDAELMDITGAGTGAEAAAQMGNQMSATMGNFLTNTASGRGFMAVLGEKKDGRYTGGLDREMLAKMGGGGIAMHDLATMGSSKMGDAAGKASFTVGQNKIASSIMEDDAGIDALLASISGEADRWGRQNGVLEDDRFSAFAKKVLKDDERMLEKLKETQKHKLELRAGQIRKMRQENSAAAYAVDMQQNYTLGGLSAQAGEALYNATGMASVKEAGAIFSAGGQETGQRMWDTITGTERLNISNVSQRQSLMRLASGTAGGAGLGTDASGRDFATSSAAGQSLDLGEAGVARELGIQSAISRTGRYDQSNENWGGGEGQALDAFMSSPQGIATKSHIMQARALREAGKDDSEPLRLARELIESNSALRAGSVEQDVDYQGGAVANTGRRDKIMAAVMSRAGDGRAAAKLRGAGGIKSHSYGDLKSARKAAEGAWGLGSMFGSDLERSKVALTTGGVGSDLFIAMSQDEELQKGDNAHRGIGVLEEELSAELRDKTGDEYYDTLARGASKKYGQAFSRESVKALASVEAQEFDFYNKKYYRFGGAGSAEARKELSPLYAGAGKSAKDYQDYAISSTTARGLSGVLGGASEEIKQALGSDFEKALASMDRLAADGLGTDGANSKGAFADLSQLLTTAGETDLSGMAGGKELMLLARRQKEGLTAASTGSLEATAKAMGVSVEDLQQISGVTGTLSNEDLSRAVTQMSGVQAAEAIGSAQGGGFFRRGETVEQQMLLSLESLAKTVKEGAETSRILAYNIRKGKPILTVPTEG
jgi:hypothetical protein